MSTQPLTQIGYSGPSPKYCRFCFSAASKAGRAVRQVTPELRMCGLCERHWREGLIHYIPSNGSERMGFEQRCEDCRHFKNDDQSPPKLDVPGRLCAWAVLDRFTQACWEGYESAAAWYSPDDMDANGECKRFTHRNDGDGPLRDPPPPDCVGQMTFSEVLEAPAPWKPRSELGDVDLLRSR